MYEYEMDPTRTEGATEQTSDVRRTDRQMDGRTDWMKPMYPQQPHCEGGINMINLCIYYLIQTNHLMNGILVPFLVFWLSYFLPQHLQVKASCFHNLGQYISYAYLKIYLLQHTI